MRLSSRLTLAAALLPAALLATACGSSPMEPTAAPQPQNGSGYIVSWGKDAPPQNASGYIVSWGKDEKPQNASGYIVSWGKDEKPQNASGYIVSWGK